MHNLYEDSKCFINSQSEARHSLIKGYETILTDQNLDWSVSVFIAGAGQDDFEMLSK